MCTALTLLLTVAMAAAAPDSSGLRRGNDHFRLGMSRAEVDSAVARRALEVMSNGTAFLVCGSNDPAIEYEQYSFFIPPHGEQLLWKVTLGYRLESTPTDLDSVMTRLTKLLGPPTSDSGANAVTPDVWGEHPLPPPRLVSWEDPSTSVRLGARWSREPDRDADRMLVTWTDRRIQRLVEARRKKDKPAAE